MLESHWGECGDGDDDGGDDGIVTVVVVTMVMMDGVFIIYSIACLVLAWTWLLCIMRMHSVILYSINIYALWEGTVVIVPNG